MVVSMCQVLRVRVGVVHMSTMDERMAFSLHGLHDVHFEDFLADTDT